MGQDSEQSLTPERQQLEQQILDALQGEIEPTRPSALYKLGLLIVAFAMLLLPVVYVLLIVVFGYGLFWFMTEQTAILKSGGRRGGGVFAYLAVLLAGGLVLLFLIKPIFARRGKHQKPKALRRDAEPFIYEYVEWVCDLVGAPVPESIRVDCDVNASASFRRGFMSLFSNDLTLTIGLPLVSGLTLRQFTAILAHEFGHFSQGAGMRLGYIINTINFWFARVAYERDAWDEKLQDAARWGGRLVLIVWMAQLTIFLTRTVLKLLMYMGHSFSCFMSREMEFDADRYATRLVGPETFESMHDSVLELAFAQQAALSDLGQFWDEGRLADDFAAWVAHRRETMPDDVREKIHEQDDQAETGVFDTHPASSDRIANAFAENTAGILHIDDSVSATVLFRNFGRLTKRVSLDYYRELIGHRVSAEQLHSIDELKQRHEAEKASRKALARYFQSQLHYLRPLPLPDNATEPPADAKRTRDAMRASRREMLEELPSYRKHLKRLDKLEDRLFDAVRASALLQVGLRIKPAEFGLDHSDRDHAREVIKETRGRLERLDEELDVFESLAARRLGSALRLLMLDKVVERLEGGEELRREVLELVPEAGFIADVIDHLPTLRLPFLALLVLCVNLEDHSENNRLIEQIKQRLETVHRRLRELQDDLGDHPYPLDHARADMTMREYVLPKVPDKDDLSGLIDTTNATFEQLVTVQYRLFARLALAAEQVETLFGLEPLPEPEDEEDDDEP